MAGNFEGGRMMPGADPNVGLIPVEQNPYYRQENMRDWMLRKYWELVLGGQPSQEAPNPSVPMPNPWLQPGGDWASRVNR